MTAKNKRRFFVLAVVAIFLLLVFGAYSIYRFSTRVSPSDLALRKKLVGTWTAENADGKWKTEFCADGTVKSFTEKGVAVIDFEWKAYGNTLQIFSIARNRRFSAMFAQIRGEYGLGGKIESITDNELQLHQYASGERTKFTKVKEVP